MGGRSDDILYFDHPEGGYEVLRPFPFIGALSKIPQLRQFQIVQIKRNELACIYVPENAPANIELNIRQALIKVLSQLSFPNLITNKFRKVKTTPRHDKSYKFMTIRSYVGTPLIEHNNTARYSGNASSKQK